MYIQATPDIETAKISPNATKFEGFKKAAANALSSGASAVHLEKVADPTAYATHGVYPDMTSLRIPQARLKDLKANDALASIALALLAGEAGGNRGE